VVQLYITDLEASVDVPLFSLKGVQRISLKPNESKILKFTISPDMLELINNDGKAILEKGQFNIWIGSSLPTERSMALGMPAPVQAVLTLK
jgi:beta-glucosidase